LKKAYFILDDSSFKKIYGSSELERISELVDIEAKPLVPINGKVENIPEDCEIILSGWGGPLLDRQFLESMPLLEAVFYGAGSIKGIVTGNFWEKDIVITSSWHANAVPVAEFTLAQVILCLKNSYYLERLYKQKKNKLLKSDKKAIGAYKSSVGIVSLGVIGRKVCSMLSNLDVEILAYDPYVSEEEANESGVILVGLDELFSRCNVVSLHAPWLPDTEGMIRGKHFKSMMQGASFINTARGAIVNQEEMIDVLRDRCDITAVLDVTYPEPPEIDSPLYNMDNVILTPHIAGSMDNECSRMGKYAVDELERYLKGEELKYRITEEMEKHMA